MIFARAWMLLFAVLPLVWMGLEFRRGRQRLAVSMKALALFAILFAIAEPSVPVSETKMAVARLGCAVLRACRHVDGVGGAEERRGGAGSVVAELAQRGARLPARVDPHPGGARR